MDDEALVALVREARPYIERTTPGTEEWLSRLEGMSSTRSGPFADRIAARRLRGRARVRGAGLFGSPAMGEQEPLRLTLHLRAAAARMEGRLDEARVLYLESRELNERLGYDVMVAGEDHNLVHVALRSDDREEAERRFRSSSDWILGNDNAYMRPYTFLDAGVLALHDGDLERAGRLIACAQRIFEETGTIPDPDDHVELDEAVARLEQELGDRFDAVWGEGRTLGPGEAEALARG